MKYMVAIGQIILPISLAIFIIQSYIENIEVAGPEGLFAVIFICLILGGFILDGARTIQALIRNQT